MKTRTIDNSQDVIDSRDFIERMEELQGERDALQEAIDEAVADAEAASLDEETAEAIEAADEARKALADWEEENGEELAAMTKCAEEAEGSPDWIHGEALIRESYFTDYIEELIKDCYQMPKEMDSGDWPWRHITIDYEAAADEAKVDYNEVDFDGVTYLIRA